MIIDSKNLEEFVVGGGLVTAKKFNVSKKRAQKSRKDIKDILVEDNLLNEEQVAKLDAYISGIPFISLKKEIISPKILKIIPEPIARMNNIIAFRQKDKTLEVAMLDPKDIRTIDFIKKKSHLKILPRLTDPDSIKKALTQYRKTLEAEFGDIIKKEVKGMKSVKDKAKDSDKD